MRALLAIETAVRRGGVALIDAENGSIVASRTYDGASDHAERLLGEVRALLAGAGLAMRDVIALAADLGPGSFTGVRIGLATAKGLAIGRGIPLFGVGSLAAMAAGSTEARARVALLDAHRGEVFAAAFAPDGSPLLPLATLAPDALPAFVAPLAPNGYVALGEIDAGLALQRSPETDLPHPVWVARLGLDAFRRGDDGDPNLVEPVYARPPNITPPKAR